MSNGINSEYFKPRRSSSLSESLANYANQSFEELGISDRVDIESILYSTGNDPAHLGDEGFPRQGNVI